MKTCPERPDGCRGKERPCQGSGPDQLQWRPPLGRASAGTIGHFELKPGKEECERIFSIEGYQEHSRSHLEIHCLSVASTLKKASSTCRSKISFEYLISQFLQVLFSLFDRPSRKPIVIPPRRRSYSSIIPSMLFTCADAVLHYMLLARSSPALSSA